MDCKIGCIQCAFFDVCTECEANREGVSCDCIQGFYEDASTNTCQCKLRLYLNIFFKLIFFTIRMWFSMQDMYF